MRNTKPISRTLTHARLLEVLDYNPTTGVFLWKQLRGSMRSLVAGGLHKKAGYLRLTIDGELMLGHRVAWFYVTGSWPNGAIDHINGDRGDNRFNNLRQASWAENLQNRPASAASTSGHKNVFWYKAYNMWQVQIAAFGKRHNGGYFSELSDAVKAAEDLRNKVHGEFACHA